MTPFKQLEKRAWNTAPPPVAPKPLVNPFKASPAAAAAKPGMSWAEKGDLAMMGASLVPFWGGLANGVWQLGRGAYNATQGNWGAAAGNLGWAAAGMIPGLGIGAKGLAMGAKGAKGLTGASKAMRAMQSANTATAGGRAMAATGHAAQRAGNALNTFGAKGVLHNGGARIGSAKPYLGFNSPQITGGKLAIGGGAMAAPIAAAAALPNYGRAAQTAAAQTPPPALDPNASWGHQMASIAAGS